MKEKETSDRLDRLWESYRWATPEPEASVNFMPELWARIDAARPNSWAVPLTRWAARLLPLAAALTLAMSAFVWDPRANRVRDPLHFSYVDVLAADLLEEQRPPLWMANGEDRI